MPSILGVVEPTQKQARHFSDKALGGYNQHVSASNMSVHLLLISLGTWQVMLYQAAFSDEQSTSSNISSCTIK